MEDNYKITIITLTKDNHEELIKTLNSIFKQELNVLTDLLVIDGSNYKTFSKNKLFLKNQEKKINNVIHIKHLNSKKKNIKGIYKSMNFGIKKAKGQYIIFMNSGDEFYNKKSVSLLYESIVSLNEKKSFCFGQAEIVSEVGLTWLIPGIKIQKIKSWLNYMLPNHQSMIVSNYMAKKTLFVEDCYIAADNLWKRKILSNANAWNYVMQPVSKFYIGGLSSRKPTLNDVKIQCKNKYLSNIRKIIIIVKFFIPKSIYKYFAFLQKFKLQIFERIFLKINS